MSSSLDIPDIATVTHLFMNASDILHQTWKSEYPEHDIYPKFRILRNFVKKSYGPHSIAHIFITPEHRQIMEYISVHPSTFGTAYSQFTVALNQYVAYMMTTMGATGPLK